MNDKKIIIFFICHGFEAMTFLRTKLLEKLVRDNWDICIISPNTDEDYFKNEFGKVARLESFHYVKSSLWIRLLVKFLSYSTYNLNNSIILNLRWIKKKQYHPIKAILEKCTYRVAQLFRNKHKIVNSIFFPVPRQIKIFIDKLKTYQSVILFSGTNSRNITYYQLEKVFHQKRYFNIKYLIGWDNLYNKAQFFLEPDLLFVWSQTQKEQATNIHRFSESKVKIVGSLNYESKLDKSILISKNAFYKDYHLDKNRKLIVYGTANNYIYDSNVELIEMLMNAIMHDKLIQKCQLLVRLHPQGQYKDKVTLYTDKQFSKYQELDDKYPLLHFDIPEVMSDRLLFDVTREDFIHLTNIMFHSDIVINVASTISLDAAIFDKPVINVAFDIPEKSYFDSCERCYEYDHYAQLIKTDGTSVVKSERELIDTLNRYLKNPGLNSENRKRMIEQQIGAMTESASERILEQLNSLL
jgi:hypothetical protein